MIHTSGQISLDFFPEETSIEQDYTATFAENMSLPVHKWYRYTAGFSAVWVNELIRQEKRKGPIRVIDPFAGSDTVLLESEFEQVESIGIEAHPYIYRIAKAKLAWNYPPDQFKEAALAFLRTAKTKNITKTDLDKRINQQ
jgi:hypothetical protein